MVKKVEEKSNKTKILKDKKFDFRLFFVVIILLCIGLIMVSSASSYYALTEFNDSNHFLAKQLFFAVLGIVIMLVISTIDYKIYEKHWKLIYFIGIALMLTVLIPGIGHESNGARRWINLGFTTLQPSEVMKIALAIALSAYIVKNYKSMGNILGYFVPGIMLIVVVGIMFLQNHLSGTVTMIFIAGMIFLASGIKLKLKIIIPATIIVAIAGTAFIMAEDFRVARITSFLHPEEDLTGDGWQAAQSLYAIGSGGLFGRGLGQSRQKYLWLPEAQNDFIFSVMSEEIGFVGSTVVIVLFAFFIIRGMRISMKSADLFGMLLATGITAMFAFQILVNIAVVTSSMPVTGMPLPFFSYGGTSLVINLGAVGILLNISRHTSK